MHRFYANNCGCEAEIKEDEGRFLLSIYDEKGRMCFYQDYDTFKGARTALGIRGAGSFRKVA